MVTIEQADENPEEYLGRDISLNADSSWKIGKSDDFAVVTFDANLRQAMINRLRTAQGELTLHPNYGSKLHELLGFVGKPEALLLARMHVKESLLQEPRIEEILTINPTFKEGSSNDTIEIEIEVKPIKDLTPLNLVFSVFVGGELSTEVQ